MNAQTDFFAEWARRAREMADESQRQYNMAVAQGFKALARAHRETWAQLRNELRLLDALASAEDELNEEQERLVSSARNIEEEAQVCFRAAEIAGRTRCHDQADRLFDQANGSHAIAVKWLREAVS